MAGPNFTYSKDPALRDLDKVRLLIGDTDTSNQRLGDAEIAWMLTEEPNVWFAAAMACRTIAAKVGAKPNKEVGDLKIWYGDQVKTYQDLARELEMRGKIRAALPWMSGRTNSEREAVLSDTDRRPEQFRLGQHDDPDNSTTVFPRPEEIS